MNNEQQLSYDAIIAQTGFLMGDILTIIDATFPDGNQNKALKDIIKSKFSDRMDFFYVLCNPSSEQDRIRGKFVARCSSQEHNDTK